jgi:hypothetical protein
MGKAATKRVGRHLIGSQLIIQELTGVTVLAIDHPTCTGALIPSLNRGVGTGLGPFVVACIDDETGFRIVSCGVATSLSTLSIEAITALFPFFFGRARAGRRLLATVLDA